MGFTILPQEKVCEYCGEIFKYGDSYLEYHNRAYCDEECLYCAVIEEAFWRDV